MVMEMTGDYDRALELYSEGLEIAKAAGDQWFAALCFTCLTAIAVFSQRTVEPEITYTRFQYTVADWRLIGDPRMTAIALNNLSLSAKILGRYDEASTALEESIALSTSVGDRWGLGFAFREIGHIAQAKERHLEAVGIFQKSLVILTELGARQDRGRVLAEMGNSLFTLGHDAEAKRAWLDSLRIGIETKGTFIILEALVGIASLQAKRGNVDYAFELLLSVINHPASMQDTKDHADRLRVGWEAHLTSLQIKAAKERLKAKTFESTVNEVLKQI
jgi:tetratricopeptide (TPR) repeat protein